MMEAKLDSSNSEVEVLSTCYQGEYRQTSFGWEVMFAFKSCYKAEENYEVNTIVIGVFIDNLALT